MIAKASRPSMRPRKGRTSVGTALQPTAGWLRSSGPGQGTSIPRASSPISGRSIIRSHSGTCWDPLGGGLDMRHQLGMLLGFSALVAVPAMAQQQAPNPNQAAAKTLLQAADKAI